MERIIEQAMENLTCCEQGIAFIHQIQGLYALNYITAVAKQQP
jgi:hypothetical protein